MEWLLFQPQTKQEAYSQIHDQVCLFLKSALEEKEVMRVIKEATGVSEPVKENGTQFVHALLLELRKISHTCNRLVWRKQNWMHLLLRGVGFI